MAQFITSNSHIKILTLLMTFLTTLSVNLHVCISLNESYICICIIEKNVKHITIYLFLLVLFYDISSILTAFWKLVDYFFLDSIQIAIKVSVIQPCVQNACSKANAKVFFSKLCFQSRLWKVLERYSTVFVDTGLRVTIHEELHED